MKKGMARATAAPTLDRLGPVSIEIEAQTSAVPIDLWKFSYVSKFWIFDNVRGYKPSYLYCLLNSDLGLTTFYAKLVR